MFINGGCWGGARNRARSIARSASSRATPASHDAISSSVVGTFGESRNVRSVIRRLVLSNNASPTMSCSARAWARYVSLPALIRGGLAGVAGSGRGRTAGVAAVERDTMFVGGLVEESSLTDTRLSTTFHLAKRSGPIASRRHTKPATNIASFTMPTFAAWCICVEREAGTLYSVVSHIRNATRMRNPRINHLGFHMLDPGLPSRRRPAGPPCRGRRVSLASGGIRTNWVHQVHFSGSPAGASRRRTKRVLTIAALPFAAEAALSCPVRDRGCHRSA